MKNKQQVNREIETQKHFKKKRKCQKRGILHERNKEAKAENSNQGFWA